MPNRIILTAAALMLFSFPAFADDSGIPPEGRLRANFRRVALDVSSTEVSNAKEYQNSPNSNLSADSETVFKGVFDFVLEDEHPDWQWNNSIGFSVLETPCLLEA